MWTLIGGFNLVKIIYKLIDFDFISERFIYWLG